MEIPRSSSSSPKLPSTLIFTTAYSGLDSPATIKSPSLGIYSSPGSSYASSSRYVERSRTPYQKPALSGSTGNISSSPQSPIPPRSPLLRRSESTTALNASSSSLSSLMDTTSITNIPAPEVFTIQELRFATATPGAPLPKGFIVSTVNTRSELFDLDKCIELLDTNISQQQQQQHFSPDQQHHGQQPIFTHPMARKSQIFYMFAPSGYGLRTLVVNYCRENRLNLIYMGNQIGQYTPGTYAKLVQKALAMQPCVVLVDRLGEHWSHEKFGSVGSELFAYWNFAGLHVAEPPMKVWFVLTGHQPLPLQDPGFVQMIGEGYALVDNISVENCVQIIRTAYSDCLRFAGFQDDRPDLPTRYDTDSMLKEKQRRLENSQFHLKLNERLDYFEHISQRIHGGVCRIKGGYVLPSNLHLFVVRAFESSCKRVTAARFSNNNNDNNNDAADNGNNSMNTNAPTNSSFDLSSDAILPTEEDFENSIRRVFPMADRKF